MSSQPENKPPGDEADEATSVAKGIAWYSHAMTISLEMVVPGVAGIWLDRQLGTGHWCALVGFVLGITVSMWHLMKLALSGPQSMPGRPSKGSGQKPGAK